MSYKRPPTKLPPCLPDDVLHDELLWNPTFEELRTDWHRQQIILARAEAAKIEADEQRAWLVAQTKRLAAIALELDEYQRGDAMEAEMLAQEKWWAETAAREAEQNKKAIEDLQKLLDAPRLNV